MASHDTSASQVTSKKEEESAPPSSKRPFTGRKGPQAKRPRFNNATGTSYQRLSLPQSIVTQPIQKFFCVHTGNTSFLNFVSTVHQVMISRDFRMTATMTVDALRYASSIAFYYRVVSLGCKLGYAYPTYSISTLKMAAESLFLPDLIAKALECIGSVTLPNGSTIVPHVPTELQVGNHADYIHPWTIAAARPAEIDENAPHHFYEGAINFAYLRDFIASTTRGLKSGFVFRKVEFNNVEGHIEFSVAREGNGSETAARTCFQMENATSQLGAAYGFRHLENRQDWLGEDNAYLSFTSRSTPFHPELFVVERVANSLVPATRN